MAEITTYRASIPSLSATLDDEAVRNLGLSNDIRAGQEVDYANSVTAREELKLVQIHHSKDPHTFDRNLVGKAQVRSSIVDHLHAKVLYPEAAIPAASLEGIVQQLAAMRAEFTQFRADIRADVGNLRTEVRTDVGNLRTEVRADVGNLRTDMGNMRTEMGNIRADVETLRQELHNGIQALDDKITLTSVQTRNIEIRKINNKKISDALPPQTLHKVIAGSGIEKARALCDGTGIRPQWLHDIQAGIGAVPEYPAPLDHRTIMDLIMFYNDDFGIEPGDGLEVRKRKVFRHFH